MISDGFGYIYPQRKDCECSCHIPGNFPGCSTCGIVQCCYPNIADEIKSNEWSIAYRAQFDPPAPPDTLEQRLIKYKAAKASN